jgi:hypothetical protein
VGFLANKHIKLCIFKPPDVDLLKYLLVHILELEAEIGGGLPLNEAVAVIVHLVV